MDFKKKLTEELHSIPSHLRASLAKGDVITLSNMLETVDKITCVESVSEYDNRFLRTIYSIPHEGEEVLVAFEYKNLAWKYCIDTRWYYVKLVKQYVERYDPTD